MCISVFKNRLCLLKKEGFTYASPSSFHKSKEGSISFILRIAFACYDSLPTLSYLFIISIYQQINRPLYKIGRRILQIILSIFFKFCHNSFKFLKLFILLIFRNLFPNFSKIHSCFRNSLSFSKKTSFFVYNFAVSSLKSCFLPFRKFSLYLYEIIFLIISQIYF